MSFLYNLCSSSSGNATYLGDREGGILFDVGIGIRTCKKLLEAAGLDYSNIKAIFLTHEHSDHIKGLESISTRYNIPVYGSEGTLRSLLDTGRGSMHMGTRSASHSVSSQHSLSMSNSMVREQLE